MTRKGFIIEDTLFLGVELFLIGVFGVLVLKSVGGVFNPDKEVVTLNTEMLRAKINEACELGKPVKLDKFIFTQPRPSKIMGVTDFLPTYAISGSGAADPHYVLYYESFPAGEAIGWEVYDDFNTRYIAPFDYGKYTGDYSTKEWTGSEAERFLEMTRDYEKEVLREDDKYYVKEAGSGLPIAVYSASDGLPNEVMWDRVEPPAAASYQERSVVEIYNDQAKDKLNVVTHFSDDVVFVHNEPAASSTSFIIAALKVLESKKGTGPLAIRTVDAEKIFISVRNKPYRADLLFRKDGLILNAKSGRKGYNMDTTDISHTYVLKIDDGKATVFVDGSEVLADDAKDGGKENAYLWGAGNPDEPEKHTEGYTSSLWNSVKYVGEAVSSDEVEQAKYPLAKKPVLINNFILSDNRNVIPTEAPVPPGSGVVKETSQLGNMGQWNGNRFEFTDYFGLTKEERAYIKYEPCGENALCLKTRDAVQKFPLNSKCANAEYIQMVYDARGMELKDLAPAAYIGGELAGIKAIDAVMSRLRAKSTSNLKAASKSVDIITSQYEWETLPKTQAEGAVSKTLKSLGAHGKSMAKTLGKKALLKSAGKLPGILKVALVADILINRAPNLAENILESSLAYKNSEFYVASPCQLRGDITITYETDCQKKLCKKGIKYPLYEYKLTYGGTPVIKEVGDHFMCMESAGKDKEEPPEFAETNRDEKVDCIKISMEDKSVRRGDFCWTNNPVFPEKNWVEKLVGLVPGKTEALNALIGCGIGAAATAWTGPGALIGCASGAGTSLAFDEANNIWSSLTGDDSPKEHFLIRAGGLPVTETTSYITYTDEEKKADDKKTYLEAVELWPTKAIGGSALKRFGEMAKNVVGIDWAWPGSA